MKKSYIIALILIVASVVIFINASKDVSTYGDFKMAEQVNEKIKIVGMLSKDKPVDYDPEVAPNEMSFFLKDQNGVEKQVKLMKAKPQGFEMSEQIVLTGQLVEDKFVATEILMKCPSKYKNEEIAIKSQS
jgi:cytochrome c-type biogenesis protein CcmE